MVSLMMQAWPVPGEAPPDPVQFTRDPVSVPRVISIPPVPISEHHPDPFSGQRISLTHRVHFPRTRAGKVIPGDTATIRAAQLTRSRTTPTAFTILILPGGSWFPAPEASDP